MSDAPTTALLRLGNSSLAPINSSVICRGGMKRLEVCWRRAYKKLRQASAGLVESAGEVPMPQAIDRKDVQRLMGEGAQVVEVLPKEEFEEEHLPGAISLPLRSLETEAKDRLDPAKPVLVYCWDAA
jgi:rhodanese-like protein